MENSCNTENALDEFFYRRIPYVISLHHLPEGAEMAGRTTAHQGGKPTAEELRVWHAASGLLYKELGLKDKLLTLTEEEEIALLSTDGMLVKRPMLIGDGFVLVGFKEDAWEKALL